MTRAEALASYDKAIALKADFAEAFSNRGNVLKVLKRLDEALASHEKAISLRVDYAEAHYNLGVFYELHRKDMPRALAQYRKYRELGGRDDRVERIVGSTFR